MRATSRQSDARSAADLARHTYPGAALPERFLAMPRNFLQIRSLKPQGVAGFRDVDAEDRHSHVCVRNLQAACGKLCSRHLLDRFPSSSPILVILLYYIGVVERYRLASLSFRREPYGRSLHFYLHKRPSHSLVALYNHCTSRSMAGLYSSTRSGLAGPYSYRAWHIMAAPRSPACPGIVALRNRMPPGAETSGYGFPIGPGFR